MSTPSPVLRFLPDASSIAASVSRGDVSRRTVLGAHLDRIDRHHRTLNAAVQVFRNPLNGEGGPLDGVPVSVKETIGLAGAPVTAGSVRVSPHVPTSDAVLVQRLKAAGAVVVARGNVPEFAMTHETDNLRYGLTRNPRNPDFSPGGSSGGDAALVASGGVAVGIGSDLGGSVRYPAHCCGVVGFKPSSGRVPMEGTWPFRDADGPSFFADSMMAFGPITRSVRDAQLVYEVLTDATLPASGAPPRFVVPESFDASLCPPVAASMQDVKDAIEAAAGLKPVAVPDAGTVYTDFLNVLLGDYGPFLTDALHQDGAPPFSFARELWRHVAGRPTIHRYYLRLVLGMQVVMPSEATAEASRQRLREARRAIRETLSGGGVLVLPTNGGLAHRPGAASAYMARPGVRRRFTPTIYANALDLPALTLPLPGHRDPSTGLLSSVQLLTAPGDEAALFAAAEQVETWTQQGH